MKTTDAEREWLKRMAEREDEGTVSVGGWIAALEEAGFPGQSTRPTLSAFSRLVQLARRERNLTLEAFASQLGIPLADLMSIERDEDHIPTAHHVARIARLLELPEAKLMALAGIAVVEDLQFREAAVRFAARAEPVRKLSRAEHEALEEFVSFLSER
jgi:transcriptional regulator with XRE-family HTH domain